MLVTTDLKKQILGKIFADDFELRQKNSKKNRDNPKGEDRDNPEEKVSDLLFIFGLFLEGALILYYVGSYKIDIDGKSVYFYDSVTNPYIRGVYFATFIFLILHQNYIRNTIKDVNHITTNEWENGKFEQYKNFFASNLLFSWCEHKLRYLYFILLAFVAGEIQYLLFTSEKLLRKIESIFDININWINSISSSLPSLFISCCMMMCSVVFLWDFLQYKGFRRLEIMAEEQGTKEQPKYNKTPLYFFMVSDGISFLLWLILLIGNKDFIDFGLLLFSAIYIGIFIFRIIKKENGHIIKKIVKI